jgi:hypothetical protein
MGGGYGMTAEKFVGFVIENKARVKEYQLGGDGTGGKCDCIGLIIGALRLGGVKWSGTHGSNYAVRNKMTTFAPIGSKADLAIGHLVYKAKAPTESGYALPNAYKNSPDKNDYYHVGVVTGVNPLEITHCTSVSGGIKIDASLGKWSHYGELEGVEYGAVELPNMSKYRVTGGKLALRQGASTGATLIMFMKDGADVEAIPREDGWSYVLYTGRTGYSMSRYLAPASAVPTLEERVAALEAWRESMDRG